jgi:murein DD-endopeptidase MepM/ murein hydrolase activator NlpD
MLKIFKISFFTVLSLFAVVSLVYADEASDLKAKIDERNNQIKQLEQEISQYNLEVIQAGSQAQTLQSTIKTLDLTQKKITTDITLTDRKISKTNLTITQIGDEIIDIAKSVDQNKKAISTMLQERRILEDTSIISFLLSGKNINDIWTNMDTINQVQNQIKIKSDQLRLLKTDLDSKQEQLGVQKKDLSSLIQDLSGKKQAVEVTKQEKATILAETKNKEQTFKDLVKTKEQLKAQFEKELYDFESQLNILIDPSKYATAGHSILSWPLDNVYITQKFGKTVGAEKLYVSGSHNGVDFRATVGTLVKAVLDGVIAGTGNTDQYAGCYSFGKWVMIKHPNGLSTIYGHLSVISVSEGQQVQTGDIIGYSGNTGYSTGPHLHLGVYATQGVRIELFKNSIGCKQAVIPLADVKAYLDPMAYLPVYNN